MYKKFGYNIVFFMLLLIIGFVVGTSSGVLSSSADNPFEDLTEEEVVETPDSNLPTSNFTPPPASAGAFERLAFAVMVLDQGKGFQSQTSQSVYAMGQEQKIFIYGYRGEGRDIVEEWQYTGGIGKNQFQLSYSDGSNVKINTITNTSNFSFSNKTYKEGYYNQQSNTPLSTYLNVQKFPALNDIPLLIDSTTSSLIKYDTRSDEKYYIIKVNVDVNKVSEQYYKAFEANGATGVSFSSMTFSFKISKTTGFLYTVEKEENFKTKYFGLNVDCTAKMKSIYTKVDTSQLEKINEIAAKNF